jgi:hypothetical protein
MRVTLTPQIADLIGEVCPCERVRCVGPGPEEACALVVYVFQIGQGLTGVSVESGFVDECPEGVRIFPCVEVESKKALRFGGFPGR